MRLITSLRLRDRRGHFVKRPISAETRRALARANGGEPLKITDSACHYCGAAGRIHWLSKSWVCFEGLEMDHVIPEFMGGDGSPGNLVLACRRCNRAKGCRNA